MDRTKIILKTSIWGVIANLLLGVFKAVIGTVTNSIAITLDAVNNIADAGSSFITIIGSLFSKKVPDKQHPFGYGRSEYLGTLIIGGLTLYAGITFFIESIKKIITPEKSEYSMIMLIILAVAVVVKILLGLYFISVGKKVEADSLVASGKDALNDVFVSLSTIVAAILYMYCNISVEAWLGAVIALIIIKTGVEILMETVSKLIGESGEVELVKDIKKTILSHENVRGVFDLILHNYGFEKCMGTVHIEVKNINTINDYDKVCREIEEMVRIKHNVSLSGIGVYAVNEKNPEISKIRNEIGRIAHKHEYVKGVHGFYINPDNKDMRFDVVVSFESKDRQSVFDNVLEDVKLHYSDYKILANMDGDFSEL